MSSETSCVFTLHDVMDSRTRDKLQTISCNALLRITVAYSYTEFSISVPNYFVMVTCNVVWNRILNIEENTCTDYQLLLTPLVATWRRCCIIFHCWINVMCIKNLHMIVIHSLHKVYINCCCCIHLVTRPLPTFYAEKNRDFSLQLKGISRQSLGMRLHPA